MKKANILFLVCILIGSVNSGYAQCYPPENVRLRLDYIPVQYGDNPFAALGWDVDEAVEHYEVFLDGMGLWDYCFSYPSGFVKFKPMCGLPEPLEQNTYHTAGVLAVDFDGNVSDTVFIDFYFSETAYNRPRNLKIENDLESESALFSWDEPDYGGGVNEPEVTGYSAYKDGEYMGETTEPQFLFEDLLLGSQYVAGVITHYSDGKDDSTFFPNYSKREFYFNDLTGPANLNVDENSGMLSWDKPNNDGDVIGGTFTEYPICYNWQCWFNPDEDFVTFGDPDHLVYTKWAIDSWVHNFPVLPDGESIEFGNNGGGGPFNYAISGARKISEITSTSQLEWSDWNVDVYDASTNEGIGQFLAHHNADDGIYGMIRFDDFIDLYFGEEEMIGYGNFTWWVQTNGTDDFSSAYNYYPNYYLIYLDGEFIDTVQPGYEEQLESSYEYQFENLVQGQYYTAGIEAVYIVGKSALETVGFVYSSSGQIPEIQVDPGSFTQTLEPGTAVNRALIISNIGDGNLNFDLEFITPEKYNPGLCVEDLYGEEACYEGDGLVFWEVANIGIEDIPCSGDPIWYHDFTSMDHTFEAGETYELNIEIGTNDDTYLDLWIDFNDDFVLTNDELILDDMSTSSGFATWNITIPSDAPAGSHIMRVRTNRDAPVTDPCSAYEYGNCCDFTSTISGGSTPTEWLSADITSGMIEPGGSQE
nr:hypothetical protein [Bacteroidota bacterium]